MLHTRSRSACRRSAAAVLAALLVVTVAAAGCSSDSEPSSSKKSSTTTSRVPGKNVTTTRPSIDPSTLKDGAEGYEKALEPLIATYVSGSKGGDDAKAAACVSPKWVKTITVKGFADAGFTPADVADTGFALSQLALTEKQATALFDALGSCDVDLRTAAVAQVTAQVPATDEVKACLDKAITDDFVEEGFVTSITGGEVPESSFAGVQKCLS